jgi:hypothetical protein
MQYVNFVSDDDDNQTMHTGPVEEGDAAYLRQATEHLRPLSDEEYMTGPAGVLQTFAKSSYVLDGDALYWCVEWEPGLLVIRMEPGKELQWVALRSPVPNFGGREPHPDDDPDYDEDDNPQYSLIFDPWDAQFDVEYREWKQFVPAGAEVEARFENALARVNGLAEVMRSRFDNDDTWLERCKQNIESWCGIGLRLQRN